MADLGINTTEHERSAPTGGAPLPAGVYTMTIVRMAIKPVKNNGMQFEVEFDISAPPQFSNRKFWDRFNIVNNSANKAITEKIAKEALADLGKAAGIHGNLTEEMLLGKTVQGRLFVKPSENPAYPEPKNECRKYYPVGVDADATDKAAKGAAPAQAATGAKPNWNTAGTPAPAAAPVAAAPPAPWKR